MIGILFLVMLIYGIRTVNEKVNPWLKNKNRVFLQPVKVPEPVKKAPSPQFNNMALNPKIATRNSLLIFIVTTIFLFSIRMLFQTNNWVNKFFHFGAFKVVVHIVMLTYFYCQNRRLRDFVIEYYNLA